MIRALFGGSFDPVHCGHVAIVERILAEGHATVVHVLPAARSPHKDAPQAPAAQRLAMARLAFAGLPGAVVENLEVVRGDVSYTVDTLTDLVARHPDDRWRLVVGSDNLRELASWREPTRLLALAGLLVVARAGWDGALPPLVAGRDVTTIRDFDHPASATAVRRELGAGRMPVAWLPAAVVAHIRSTGLYGIPAQDLPKAAT